MHTFLFHSPGITVKLIREDCSTVHHIYRSLLAEDVVVHFRRLQILVDGQDKSVIAAYLLWWIPEKQTNKVQWALQRRAGTGKQHASTQLCCCNHLLLTWRNDYENDCQQGSWHRNWRVWDAKIHPHGYVAKYHVAIQPSGIPLNTKIGVNILTGAMIVTTNVACLVSHVDMWIWTVHASTNSKVLCILKVYRIRDWSMLMM